VAGKIRRIYLDMDGVLADWIAAVCALHGLTWKEVTAKWAPMRGFTIHEPLGMTYDALEDSIDKVGEAFWLGIPKFPWARSLYFTCCDIAPTCIVTKPPRGFRTSYLKVIWLRRLFGPEFEDFFLGSQKHFFAAPGHVLIDDGEHNCEHFEAKGGKSILFPQYWNTNHELWPKAAQYTVDRLYELDGRDPIRRKS
jgi:5'(3')-deoxyribonucleotidase